MEKPKIRHQSRLGRMLPYLVMTVLIALLGIGIESAFYATAPIDYLTSFQISIVVLMLRLVPVLLQVVLIERFLKQSMRGWFVRTGLGTLGTLLILGVIKLWSDNPDSVQLVGFLTVYAPTALLQGLWLCQRVKNAWLWPAMVVLAQYILPALWLRFDDYSMITTLFNVHPVLVAVLQAILLYILLAQPKNAEKAKVDFAAQEQHNEERLTRLQERDHGAPIWDQDSDQTLQRKTL